MKLFVISYPGILFDEAKKLNCLFEAGMLRLHLRKPDWDTNQLEQLLKQIDRSYYGKIVLHDHFNLAEKYQLGGIHFTGKTKYLVKKLAAFPGTKSCSVHMLSELGELPEPIDYCFLSPVFPSISKTGYVVSRDMEEVASVLFKPREQEVFALGGIQVENAAQCCKAGFNGVAVLGALWQENEQLRDVTANFKQISFAIATMQTDQ